MLFPTSAKDTRFYVQHIAHKYVQHMYKDGRVMWRRSEIRDCS